MSVHQWLNAWGSEFCVYSPVAKLYFSGWFKVELYRMVRQLHLRTQGDQESSSAHPDVIGDRCVFVTEDERRHVCCGEHLSRLTVRKITLLTFTFFLWITEKIRKRAYYYLTTKLTPQANKKWVHRFRFLSGPSKPNFPNFHRAEAQSG